MTRFLERLRAAPVYIPVAMIAVGGWAHRWMDEDAYINLRIVDQVLAGHGPVFNAGERVEAATSPLWLAILVVGRVVFGAFVRAEWIAVVASLLAAVAAFAIGGRAARLLHRGSDGVVVPVGLVLVAAVAVVWDFSTSGLEMGLVFLWLAASWWVLLSVARSEPPSNRRRFGFGVVLGLAPLVRPELGLTMISFLVAWFALVRPRRIRFDLLAIFALPVAYEIFRMGYYASLVPSTALAKDAAGLHVGQGWTYAEDFIGTYHLWVSGILMLAVLAIAQVGRRDRRLAIAMSAMIVGGLLHAAYIVAIGGDYMHGRLLLPAFFALALPASISLRRGAVLDVGVGALAGAWAVVSVISLRPPPPPLGFTVSSIADWRTVSGAKVVLDDGAFGLNGHEAAAAYARGVRGYFTVSEKEPRPGKDPTAFVLTLGSIGVPAYDAGRRVWVIDIGGLAEPLAARTEIVPDRPAGHRKQVDPAWYAARFAAPTSSDSPEVIAARRAVGCGPVAGLLDAVDDDLTPGRFLSNIWHSFEYTRLHIPADPIIADQRWCPPP
ncbi:MAG: arabinofuranosyltransferase [Acidimicrobiaceae bacterium]